MTFLSTAYAAEIQALEGHGARGTCQQSSDLCPLDPLQHIPIFDQNIVRYFQKLRTEQSSWFAQARTSYESHAVN